MQKMNHILIIKFQYNLLNHNQMYIKKNKNLLEETILDNKRILEADRFKT